MPRQRATRKVAGKAQWGVPQESWGYHPPLAWMLIVRLDVSGAMYPQESWGCHPTLAWILIVRQSFHHEKINTNDALLWPFPLKNHRRG